MSAPMATCPVDDEPLIFTFERPKKEFCCVVCGRWYEFLDPKPAAVTPDREARLAELQTLFDGGRRGPVTV